jgi:tetratricopeptide (TPR) repeat protein
MNSFKLTIAVLMLGGFVCCPKASAGNLKGIEISSVEISQRLEELIQKGNERSLSGDYQGAINYYTQAIKQNPKNAQAYLNRTYATGTNRSRRGCAAP